MKILIWRSYGCTDIYCAETPKQLTSIFKNLKSNLEDWNLEEQIKVAEEVFGTASRSPTSPVQMRRAISALYEHTGGGHDSFEEFCFTDVRYD